MTLMSWLGEVEKVCYTSQNEVCRSSLETLVWARVQKVCYTSQNELCRNHLESLGWAKREKSAVTGKILA